jgi:hypothetical protein
MFQVFIRMRFFRVVHINDFYDDTKNFQKFFRVERQTLSLPFFGGFG